MLRKLVFIIVALQVWGYNSAVFACDQLNLYVTGQLSRSAQTLSNQTDASPGLSRVYDVPLSFLDIEGESAQLLFTRTLPRVWRVDVVMSSDPRTSTASILTRPAATLIEFSDDGKQIGEQSVILFPAGGKMNKIGTSIHLTLRDFIVGSDDTQKFKEEHFTVNTKDDCVEPRKILYVKTKPDKVRDELNPHVQGE